MTKAAFKSNKPNPNHSVLFLALFCLLLYIKDYISLQPPDASTNSSPIQLYVEIVDSETRIPVVFKFESPAELTELSSSLGIHKRIRNGDKLTRDKDGNVKFSRINGRKSMSLEVKVGINSATADDLVVLPGIGAKLAQKIIEERDKNGRFNSIDELSRIMGIGRSKIHSIEPYINLD